MMVLKKIDLSKSFKRGEVTGHPDIQEGKTYLAKINDNLVAGQFIPQWYGWSFSGYWMAGSIQFDRPGTNGDCWKELYEILDECPAKNK